MTKPSVASRGRPPQRLRAAIERLIREQAAARIIIFPARTAAAESQAAASLQRRSRRDPRRGTITLREGTMREGNLSTVELLDAALAVVTQGHHRPGDWRLEGWFFRVALQAACEAILEGGRATFPLAVQLERHPHKQSWLAMPRVPLPAPVAGLPEQRQPGEPLRLFVRLEEPAAPGETPLSILLDATLNVLADGHHAPGRWHQERWFFRQVLRATCEAVLGSDAGKLPLPLRVRLCRRNQAALPMLHLRVRTFALVLQTQPRSA